MKFRILTSIVTIPFGCDNKSVHLYVVFVSSFTLGCNHASLAHCFGILIQPGA